MKDKFTYSECSHCGCVQIVSIPEELGKYYPGHYYSYVNEGEQYIINPSLTNRVKKFLKKHHTRNLKIASSPIGAIVSLFVKDNLPWLLRNKINFDSRILDIGCGSGSLLLNMKYNGFNNLSGIDPFIEKNIFYQCGVKIYKESIFEHAGQYDFIMLNHSFEHMDNPYEVLKRAYTLLSDEGQLLISIPVADSYAWRKYKANWVQLDAPRHFYLHTTKSMQLLADECAFQLKEVIYNSTDFQFLGSEKYSRNLTLLAEHNYFTPDQRQTFKSKAIELNNMLDGDSAIFYFSKRDLR
ncbi:MAG: class I SAM-dependent methyltransferase [Chitinophagaceae bacterium]|nr:class I SAM-dependent methyltransferase [Chitinophagaceae bacterium]